MKAFLTLIFLAPLWLLAQYQPVSNGEVVTHTDYTLSYAEEHEQAEWVYYELTSDEVYSSRERTNDFRPDPQVSTGSAQLSDYKGSGYDRGHLAPAADMKASQTTMSESFFLSNMSPQAASFNRGAWKNLESLVRDWAIAYKAIYVVTGPIFEDNIETIGANQVTVPGYYYKVIYAPSAGKMIAIVMPNDKIKEDLSNFVVSTDYVELKTGIDFFSQLEDSIENELEASTSIDGFTFKSSYKGSSSSTTSTAVQCKGIASSTGVRCKNMTKNENGYCQYHQSQAPDYVKPQSEGYVGQCCATTKKGTRCKRQASGGTKYCWQHQ